jgi:glycosyltransferase involved in cell wall biosynthesis
VDQFHPSLRESPAIANEVQALQEIFQRIGHRSRIYAGESFALPNAAVQSFRNYHPTSRDILLVHHSLGSPLLEDVFAARSRKVVLYHSVASRAGLAGLDPALQQSSKSGRADLMENNTKVKAAVAHSAFSAGELAEAGYSRVEVIPYTLDERLYAVAPDAAVLKRQKAYGWKNLLVAGRILPHLCVEDSLFVLDYLTRAVDPHWRLVLAGSWQGAEAYRERLLGLIGSMRLENVVWAGETTQAALLAYFKTSEALLCLSEHDGSGAPLVEAMRLEVPAVAYAAGAAPEVLGDAGVLFRTKDWPLIGETVALLASDWTLRQNVLKAQHTRAEFFSPEMAEQRWHAWLDRLD